jgi:hypothetical protein
MNSKEAVSLIGFMQRIQSKRQSLMASCDVADWHLSDMAGQRGDVR